MNQNIIKIFSKLLRDTADKLDAGTCEISEDLAIDVILMLSHLPISKDLACTYLNISRSKFDDLVKNNILPKGKKVRGFKELIWYKDELKIIKK